MRILVVGLLSRPSGKTLVAAAVARRLAELGHSVAPFKPISVHDWYRDYDTSLQNVEEGLAFSGDVAALIEAAGANLPYEVANPVHGVTFPPSPLMLRHKMIARYHLYLEDPAASTALLRLTLRGRVEMNVYAVNRALLDGGLLYHDPDYVSRVLASAHVLIDVYSSKQVARALQLYAPASIGSCYSYVKRRSDAVVVEGFRDLAAPSGHVLDADVVLAVAPGTVMAFDGRSYAKAVSLYSGVKGALDVRVQDVLELLTPLKAFSLPPMSASDASDPSKVATRLEPLLSFIERAARGGGA